MQMTHLLCKKLAINYKIKTVKNIYTLDISIWYLIDTIIVNFNISNNISNLNFIDIKHVILIMYIHLYIMF